MLKIYSNTGSTIFCIKASWWALITIYKVLKNKWKSPIQIQVNKWLN